jgi:hypothetical protein
MFLFIVPRFSPLWIRWSRKTQNLPDLWETPRRHATICSRQSFTRLNQAERISTRRKTFSRLVCYAKGNETESQAIWNGIHFRLGPYLADFGSGKGSFIPNSSSGIHGCRSCRREIYSLPYNPQFRNRSQTCWGTMIGITWRQIASSS